MDDEGARFIPNELRYGEGDGKVSRLESTRSARSKPWSHLLFTATGHRLLGRNLELGTTKAFVSQATSAG
jgi:hypothetical protein